MSSEQGRSDEERRKRLAAALRDNLKRRKAQDRARREIGQTNVDKPGDDAPEPGRSE